MDHNPSPHTETMMDEGLQSKQKPKQEVLHPNNLEQLEAGVSGIVLPHTHTHTHTHVVPRPWLAAPASY